jgi:hypothetical protein
MKMIVFQNHWTLTFTLRCALLSTRRKYSRQKLGHVLVSAVAFQKDHHGPTKTCHLKMPNCLNLLRPIATKPAQTLPSPAAVTMPMLLTPSQNPIVPSAPESSRFYRSSTHQRPKTGSEPAIAGAQRT